MMHKLKPFFNDREGERERARERKRVHFEQVGSPGRRPETSSASPCAYLTNVFSTRSNGSTPFVRENKRDREEGRQGERRRRVSTKPF